MRLANQNTLREVIGYFRFKGWFQGLSDLEAYRLILNYQRDKELSLGLHYQGEALKASRPYVIELIKLAYLADSPHKPEDFQELKDRLLQVANIPDQEQRELEIFEVSTRLLSRIGGKLRQPRGVDLSLLGSVQNPETGERIRFTNTPELAYLNTVLSFPYYVSVLFALPDGEPFKNAIACIDSSKLALNGSTPIQLMARSNGQGSSDQLFISLSSQMRISPDAIILSKDNVLAFESGGDTSQDQQANAPTFDRQLSDFDRQLSAFQTWIDENGGKEEVERLAKKSKFTKEQIHQILKQEYEAFSRMRSFSSFEKFWQKAKLLNFSGSGRPKKVG